jgi:hypothetical protein
MPIVPLYQLLETAHCRVVEAFEILVESGTEIVI